MSDSTVLALAIGAGVIGILLVTGGVVFWYFTRGSAGRKWILLGSSATVIVFLAACLLAYFLGFIQLPPSIISHVPILAVGPVYATVDLASSDGNVRARVTYPTEVGVGDYADIVIEIENEGTTDWKHDSDEDKDNSLILVFSSYFNVGTDHFFRGLSVVSMEPSDYGNNFSQDGSWAWISLGSLAAGERVVFRMQVLATMPGVFRATVSAGPRNRGGDLDDWKRGEVELEIRTIVTQ